MGKKKIITIIIIIFFIPVANLTSIINIADVCGHSWHAFVTSRLQLSLKGFKCLNGSKMISMDLLKSIAYHYKKSFKE